MKQVHVSLLFAAALVAFVAQASASEPLDLFDREASARQHCRGDVVVWLDVPSKSYRLEGQAGYGATKNGGYTCKKDAERAGNHGAGKVR